MAQSKAYRCAICHRYESEISPNYFVTTPRGHVFHFNGCLKELIDNGDRLRYITRCPLCDEDIDINNVTRLQGIDPCNRHPGINRRETAATDDTEIQESVPDYIFNIILLGDAKVGKTSLLQRYTEGKFNFLISTTIGAQVRMKKIEVGNKLVHMTLWDTGGQETFQAISKNFVRNAHGVVFTYSYGEQTESLDFMDSWLKLVESCGLPGRALMLVANKSDIPEDERTSTTEQGQDYARLRHLPFFETSAKDDYNVDAVFQALALQIIQNIEAKELEYQSPAERLQLHEEQQNSNRRRCRC